MDIVSKYIKTTELNKTCFELEGNKNIVGVSITLYDNFKGYCGGEIAIEYAQNGITSVPIDFGKIKIENSDKVELFLDTPVSVSHLYILMPNEKLEIKDIEIYEVADGGSNYYPKCFDTDLKENYYIDSISVFTTNRGYSHYSIYTSLNGRDFDFLARKDNDQPCDFENGDTYLANGREARIIRVYIEYNNASTDALFDRMEFKGSKSGTAVQTREPIDIPKFSDTEYNTKITEADVFAEVNGIISRRVGERYVSWFEYELASNPNGTDNDYFELTTVNDKVHIKGNNGVSLATGLNHYLKYYCKVNICQVGDQVKMPAQPVVVDKVVFKETKTKVRYSYNYCTLSYSMAFMGEKEWQDELDWLALNGVNVVLDATAQEEVWRRFLTGLGYSHEEILRFIAGPAYYAWAYMANLTGFGGPVHDSWFAERTELARKNQLRMRKLGMYPVLQAYCGMLPTDITEHFEDIDIIPQGTWCSFDRPTMLRTTAPVFKEYAEKFYKAQAEVYGDYSIYYATDPFHEGGNVADMRRNEIAREVLSALLSYKKDAIWIIQSWQGNPTSELLKGIGELPNGKPHALILDLYAEKDPNYLKGHSANGNYGYSQEFDSTPWVFCMLNNFGGRLGLHGHLDNLAKWIPDALNNCKCLRGIGITPEASFNNPVLYDFLFETVWTDSAASPKEEIDVNKWIKDYCERRYGAVSASAEKAWEILINTVYKAELNKLGQGAPESIVNTRPTLESRSASSWGNAVIAYDKEELKKAARLMLEDYEQLKNSTGYKFDLITIYQQILSNTVQDVHLEMAAAYKAKNLCEFEKKAKEFLDIADLMDKVTAGSEYYMLGRWIEQAKALARNADDFTKMLYEFNARSIITTWGSYNQSEIGGLHDYSNRQWSGLIGDFYKPRWERWIAERSKELKGLPYDANIDWFNMEWKWVRQNNCFKSTPDELDLKAMAQQIL